MQDPDLVIRAADLAGALQIQGVGIEARTAQSLINGLAHVGRVDRGIELLDGWMNANIEILEDDEAAQEGPAHVMATLLEAAARADDTDAITQVLLRMARVGLSPAPHSMVTLLQCFSRLGNINTAHNMLEWMRRSGIEPTAVHYAAVMTMPSVTMTSSKAQNFLAKAKEAYQDMKAHDVQPSAYFYAAYINVCSRLKDLDAARDAWLDMERDDTIEPDLVCYTTMIDACAKGGDVDGAFHLYEEMPKNGIKPDGVVFATLISAVSLAVDQAKEIWRDMKKAGIKPDARTISVYLDALLRAGENTSALELLLESSSASEKKGAGAAGAVAGLFEQAISSAAGKADITLLKSLIQQIKVNNVQFTTMAVTSLLTARARQIQNNKKQGTSGESAALPWHIDVDMDSTSGGGKYKALQISSTSILDTLVEALGTIPSAASYSSSLVSHQDDAAVLIGCLSVEASSSSGDSMEQALDLYTNYSERMDRGVRIWALKLLLAGALATEAQQQHVALTLKVVAAAREFSKLPTSGGWWWDQKTQKVIARQLRKAPEAIELVGDVGEVAVGDVRSYPRRLVKRPTS